MNLLRKIRAFFRKEKLDRDMAEEMRFHLNQRIADNIDEGMPPGEARYAAQRAFGGVEQIKERARNQRGFIWLEEFVRDVAFALRQLAKSPGFAVVAILSLALGIGANTALFSIVDDLLLKSLPVSRPDELVLFRWHSPRNGLNGAMSGQSPTDPVTGLRSSTSLSYFIFDRLRASPIPKEVLSDLFAFASLGRLNLNIDNQAELAAGQVVTGGYFAGLGVPAARGRTLGPDDDRESAAPVAMISHAFWQRRFGGAPDVIGKTIRVNNVAVTIVGITPPDFQGTLQLGETPDLSLPMMLEPQLNPRRPQVKGTLLWWLHIAGRLRPGVASRQAQARLEPLFVRAARDAWLERQAAEKLDPIDTRVNPILRLTPGGQGLVETRRSYERSLQIMTGIVAVVLFIACTNVASLLLARAAARTKEIAVRLSIGASRGRLIRQLLTESVVLSLLGGAIGVGVAYWGRAALLALRPISNEPLALDWRVLGFTLGVSVLTGVLFGLAPAWRATRVDLNSVMKGNADRASGRSRFPLRSVLMIAQVALSVVLLVGAGLFVRTLGNLRRVDAGFNRENLLLFALDAGLNGYTPAQSLALFERVLERVGQLPTVRAAGFSRVPFLTGGRSSRGISVPGRALPSSLGVVHVNVVHPAFFETMGIPLVLGRNFTGRDLDGAQSVAVISQSFADKIFPGENPIGQRFVFRGRPDSRPLEIVGVVRDVHYADLRAEVPATAYTPIYQETASHVTFAVRTAGDPHALGAAIRKTIQEADPAVPVFDLRTQDELVTRLIANERLFALLTSFFGGVALLLTCIGLYGLMAQSVTSRTREIGIRMALGAQLRTVVSRVLSEGLCLLTIGVVLGLAVALGVTRFVANMLFGVPPTDLVTLGGAGALLVGVAALACWLPARRAAKVDPMIALRCE